ERAHVAVTAILPAAAVLRRDRPPCKPPVPKPYDCTRWFQLHVRHTSTTWTVNSLNVVAILASSLGPLAEPDACLSSSPNTHDTKVSCAFRQIGHSTSLGSPWNSAARSRYGSAARSEERRVGQECG